MDKLLIVAIPALLLPQLRSHNELWKATDISPSVLFLGKKGESKSELQGSDSVICPVRRVCCYKYKLGIIVRFGFKKDSASKIMPKTIIRMTGINQFSLIK